MFRALYLMWRARSIALKLQKLGFDLTRNNPQYDALVKTLGLYISLNMSDGQIITLINLTFLDKERQARLAKSVESIRRFKQMLDEDRSTER